MDVYLVPLARDRFECYFEAADDEEPASAEGQGVFARLRAWFSAQLRDAERARHLAPTDEPRSAMARVQRKLMRWIAERVTEQRLLWHLGRAESATLHAPDDLDPREAERVMRAAMRIDADRHLTMLALHSVGLIVSLPVMVLPGPNVLGYFFTFTVVGHFLALRGARRGLSRVIWRVAPNADLTALRGAWSLEAETRHGRIHEVADRLGLERLATFVERMTTPTA